MRDPFLERGEQLRQYLLKRECSAAEHELFPLGYLIPQLELVLDRAEYDPATVSAHDFDAVCWQLVLNSSGEDGMSASDVASLQRLWQAACAIPA